MQFTQSFQMRLNSTTKKKKKISKECEVITNQVEGTNQMLFAFFLLVCLFLSHTSVKVADKKPQSSQVKLLEK